LRRSGWGRKKSAGKKEKLRARVCIKKAAERRISMSILTEVSKIFESTTNDGRHQSIVAEAVSMLTSREGGLSALTQNFEQNGLGHIISSWIGTGENAPISPNQIKSVLGSDCVAHLARKAGISPEMATQYLTKSLPSLVDALTPNGNVGGANDLMSRGKEIPAAFASKRQGV
jgi:uncharacterized protein YidB (DUF937 family)